MKKLILGLAVAGGLVLGAGGTAFAGEVTGAGLKGKPNAPFEAQGANHARSECAFSGRDTPDSIEGNPEGFDDDALMIHGTQSYGQFVARGLKAVVPSPGVACNPTTPPPPAP